MVIQPIFETSLDHFLRSLDSFLELDWIGLLECMLSKVAYTDRSLRCAMRLAMCSGVKLQVVFRVSLVEIHVELMNHVEARLNVEICFGD